MEATTRRWWRWPRRRVAAVLMMVGLLALIPVVVRIVHIVSLAVTGPTLDVPGSARVNLDSGRWIVFERTNVFRNTTRTGDVTITASDVTVTSSTGESLATRNVASVQTVTRGADFFEGAVVFSVPEDGDYEIAISEVPATRVLVARPLTDTFRDIALWVVLGILAVAAAVVGLVFVVLPASSPSGARPMVHSPGAPPGWFPDPYGTGLRWWNGVQWTEHTQAGS